MNETKAGAPTGEREEARACLVCPEKAVRGMDPASGALWCWQHGPFYESDLFFQDRAPAQPGEGEPSAWAALEGALYEEGYSAKTTEGELLEPTNHAPGCLACDCWVFKAWRALLERRGNRLSEKGG